MDKRSRKPASALHQLTAFLGRVTNVTKTSSKKRSFEEAKADIDEIIDTLKNADDTDYFHENVIDGLMKLGAVALRLLGIDGESIPEDMFSQYQEKLVIVADYLGTKEYARLFAKMAISFYHSSYVVEKRSYALGCLNLLLDSFRNYTDRSQILAKDFGESGGVDAMLKIAAYLYTSSNGFAVKDKEVARMAYTRVLAILHNCIRVYPDNRIIYRKADAIAVLSDLKTADNSSDHSDVFLVLILSYIVDEQESEALAKSQDCVRKLTMLLNEAVQSKGHNALTRDLFTTTVFSALELLDGLNHLAVSDANKAEIEKHGGLASTLRMLNEDFSEEEKAIATKTLWRLAFLESVKRNHEVQESVDSKKIDVCFYFIYLVIFNS